MKKKFLSMLLSVAMVVTMFSGTIVNAAPEDESSPEVMELQAEYYGTNVARRAKASASHTNPYSVDPASMNDGQLATSDPATSWNSWGGDDETYPVTTTLTWDSEFKLSGMRVMWWADNAEVNSSGNVTWPKSCQVRYKDANGKFQTITGMTNEKEEAADAVGVERNTSSNNGINGNNDYWNYVKFPETITTTELQLVIDRNGTGSNGVGISEWEAFGVGTLASGTNVAKEAAVVPSYINASQNADAAKAALVDGKPGENGNETSWNTWGAGDTEYPVTLDFDWGEDVYEVSSLRVMWWSDNGGVAFPKSCKLQSYNSRAKEWEDITDLVDENYEDTTEVGVKFGSETTPVENQADASGAANRYYNGVVLKTPVTTSKLRLVVDRNGEGATGLGASEVEIYGTKKESAVTSENIAPKALATAAAQNTPVTNVNDGKLASGASTSWNTWNSNTYPTPITLTWNTPYELTGMRVMYWSDYADVTGNSGVAFPKSAELQYYDHETNKWVSIDAMTDEAGADVTSVGVKYGSADEAGSEPGSYLNGNNRYWNAVTFKEPVKTTQIRMLIDRQGSGAQGIGIGEWEVFGEEMNAEWGQMVAAKIDGIKRVQKGNSATYTAKTLPEGIADVKYAWSLKAEEGKDGIAVIEGDADKETVKVKTSGNGKVTLNLTAKHTEDGKEVTRTASFDIQIDGIESVDTYKTATSAGTAPILPKTVVANGLTFDDPTPSVKGNNGHDFAEEFNSKLVPVVWEKVDPKLYAKDQAGKTFTVKGTVTSAGETFEAKAEIKVNAPVVAPVANSTVTFENIQLTDEFWNPKQKVNAVNSLNKAIYQIEQASGGEPNFVNAIKRLNGEPYDTFQGFVFQDSDIYKSIEAISYTLSVIDKDTDPDLLAQKEKLEEKLAYWIDLIEQVQYADGYINTHFSLRSPTTSGGTNQGTHRWRAFANHEMYNAGHFLESVVAYTRYREGIGSPDYSLYVVGKRCADQIAALFGPEGTRHEVPGHEEIELALVKFGKLVEEYEGEGTGDIYIDTAKTLIDRRGESASLRESGYKGGDYSQDARPITEETNGVGHAVRACYFYAGVTDVATLLPEGDEDRAAYLKTMDAIWDSVANKKTYITGGIGVASHGEDFGGDYELPNNNSYCETCASIALANWNQRMNLIHEDAKYADVVERTLYNSILNGTNLTGDKFFYSSLLEVSNGNRRSDWFACACCPPNLMRTIAKLSEYMYTVHGDDLFVNLYIGSDGAVNVDGTKVGLKQETNYPWEGAVKMTVNPEKEKEFTMKIRIPGWVEDQKNTDVTIKVNDKAVTADAKKGYVEITRTWKKGDVVMIDMPMEVRKTEADPNVTTNAGRIALERGPVVYCMEKAGNAQMNEGITNFDPLKFVIPRDADLTATFNKDLLNGVVEITGDVRYDDGGTMKDAKLQAVPYYAWNNRGDDGVQGQNSSTKMLIWTKAEGKAKELTGIKVTPPSKTEYKQGEALNLDGMKVTAQYDDESEKQISADKCEVKGYDAEKVGEQTITVTYEGKSATFKVTVVKKEEPVVLTGIKVTAPAKTEYKQGEALDLTGIKVTAQYSDGSEKQITTDKCKVEGYDAEKVGEQTIKVTYEGKSATFKVTVVEKDEPQKPVYEIFTDVSKDAWYVDNVQYVYDKKIMLGMTDTFFGSDTILKRSHFATILYRMEGEPKVAYTDRFDDVPEGAFYTDAVLWASSEDIGVIAGYENGNFGPDDIITREQMAVMLYRYAEYKKYDTKAADDLKGFTDSDKVSPFATDAMKWAVGAKLIKGEGNGKQLNPQGETSRGVCAAIMQRFLTPYDKE